jgi:hypothetical protein
MRRWGQIGPAEVLPALSHGWWKGWRGPKPLTADFRDRGRGFNGLSVVSTFGTVLGTYHGLVIPTIMDLPATPFQASHHRKDRSDA